MYADRDLRKALVLLLLRELEDRQLTPITEYELHQVIRDAQAGPGEPFKYIDAPISYSFDLHEMLESLDAAQYVDEVFVVRDGWVPRCEYGLSVVGRAEAAIQSEEFQGREPELLERVHGAAADFAARYLPARPIDPRR